ncbi:MAG: DUF58 domain-containing protein [Pirellulales bacterium]
MKYEQPAVLSRIERLELRARRVVEGWLIGRQASPYLGSATEFAAHRPYATGDEPRHLDWKVFARTKRLVVKQFQEETHLPCWILVDASQSMRYGEANGWSKYDHAATLAVCLAYLLTQQQDATGLAVVTEGSPRVVAAQAHPSQVTRIAETLEQVMPAGGCNLPAAIRRISAQWQRRALVILIGDFLDDPRSLTDSLAELRGRKHEAFVCHVLHGDELTFPFEGMTLFRGLEAVDQIESDPRSLRAAYLEQLNHFLGESRAACARAGVDHQLVDTREPLDATLSRYLGFRHGRA